MSDPEHQAAYSRHARDRIHQGDIIRGLDVVVERAPDGSDLEPGAEIARRDFAVVLTQECDLEQDHRVRCGTAGASTADKALVEILLASTAQLPKFFGLTSRVMTLPSVLLASARDAVGARKTALENKQPQFNRESWSRVAANKDERYQTLEGFGEVHTGLLVDFKQVFTVSTEYLYAVLKRSPESFLCSLSVPYREHLSSRFSYFMSRVALPRDHADPVPPAGQDKALKK